MTRTDLGPHRPDGDSGSMLAVDGPLGPISLCARDGALVGLHLDDRAGRRTSSHPSGDIDAAVLSETARQLDEYLAGRRRTFDVPLRLEGTAFQSTVWRALLEIPYGRTWSYGELARHIGRPTASRAVGAANGRNPISIIVPCHRVIGTDRSLTGYAWGPERKRWLLDLEGGHGPDAQAQLALG